MNYKEFGDDLNGAVDHVLMNFNSGNKAKVIVSRHDFKLNPVSLNVSDEEFNISSQNIVFGVEGNAFLNGKNNTKLENTYIFDGIVSHYYRSGKYSDDVFNYSIKFINHEIDETSIDIGKASNIFLRIFENPKTKSNAPFFDIFLFTRFSEIIKGLSKVVVHAEKVFNDDKSWRNAGYLILSKAILAFSTIAKKYYLQIQANEDFIVPTGWFQGFNKPRSGRSPNQKDKELFGAGKGEMWCPKCFGSGCDLCETKGKIKCRWCGGSGVGDRVSTDNGLREIKCYCA